MISNEAIGNTTELNKNVSASLVAPPQEYKMSK